MNQGKTLDSRWLCRLEKRQYTIQVVMFLNEGFKYWKHRNLIAEYSSNPKEFRNQVDLIDKNLPIQNVSWLKKVNEDDLSNIAIDYNMCFERSANALSNLMITKNVEHVKQLMGDTYSYIMESDDTALKLYRMVDYVFFGEWIEDIYFWNATSRKPLFYYNIQGFTPFKAFPYIIRAEINTILSVFNNKLKGDKICHISDLEIPQVMKEAGFTTAM